MKKTKRILAAVLMVGFLAILGGCVVVDRHALKEAHRFAHHHYKHR